MFQALKKLLVSPPFKKFSIPPGFRGGFQGSIFSYLLYLSVKIFNHICIILLNLLVNTIIVNDILKFTKDFSVLCLDLPAADENFGNSQYTLEKFCHPSPFEIIPPFWNPPPFYRIFFILPFLEFLKMAIPPSIRGVRTMQQFLIKQVFE